MKIGILKADSVMPQFQAEFGDYPEMFVKRLSGAASAETQFVTFDVEHSQYPAQIDECDGYVITGSKKSVYDDEAWIRQLEAFVLELHAARVPLVGVCFGHQLVAQALGGKTEPADVGWGVGVHTSQVLKQAPFMQPPLDDARILVSHKDQVTKLPPGAERVATSAFCPNSMFTIDQHIFCVQGHPEFIRPYSEALMNFRREILGETIYRNGVESLRQPLDSDILASWIMRFLEAGSTQVA